MMPNVPRYPRRFVVLGQYTARDGSSKWGWIVWEIAGPFSERRCVDIVDADRPRPEVSP